MVHASVIFRATGKWDERGKREIGERQPQSPDGGS